MIADLDETIRQMLIEELPIKNGEYEVSFDQPKREWSAKLSRPTINLFLYDVRENPTLRQHGWERLGSSNGNKIAHLKRKPVQVDCFYMLTTWVRGGGQEHPEDEHRLLTRCLMALFRFPILPEDRLIGTLRNPPYDIQARLAHHDRLTNPAEVWSALDNEMRPSVSYIITLALDPWTEVTGPAVRNLTLHSGQASELPRHQRFAADGQSGELNFIGGTVTDKKEGAGMVGVEVAIKGTGLLTKTDESGRFRLGSMPPGDYTLVIWPHEGKPKEKPITVPLQRDQDYDLVV